MPERLPEAVNKVLSPEADVLERVVAQFVQFPVRAGAPAPEPNGADDPSDRCQRRGMPLAAARHRTRERQRESDSSGAVPAGRSAALVAATVEQRHSAFAAQILVHHRSSSFNQNGGPGPTVPSRSRSLIWQITAKSPARNLRNFCSPHARTSRDVAVSRTRI